MPSKAEIQEKIIEIVAKKMDKQKEDIKPEMSYMADIGCDSLDTVEIMMEIEDEFSLNVPEEDAEKIQTIADTVKYVEQKVAASAE